MLYNSVKKIKMQNTETDFYQIGRYTFDFENRILLYNDNVRKLTPKEANLLKLLLDNDNIVLTRDFILRTLWNDNYKYSLGRSLDVFIPRLRKYLKDDSNIAIHTIHGLGYKLSI